MFESGCSGALSALTLSCLALLVAAPLQASQAGPADAAVESEVRNIDRDFVRDADPDFFFGRPHFTLMARMGLFQPRAQSQFHDFAIDHLTLDRSDFRGFTGGVEAGLWLSDRVELAFALEGTGTTTDSEYRDLVEDSPQGELPIRQTTRISQGPTASVALKLYPMARGERLSEFAWVPHRIAPFVTGGVGGTRYQLEQWGDWVIEDGWIVTEEYRGDGAGLVGFLGGGVDLTLTTRVALAFEGRYSWGSGRMTEDFRDFAPLDLAGLRLTAGLAYRF